MTYEIYNDDCLIGMKKIPSGSVDLIATDPPYCVGASSNGTKSSFSDFNLMRPFWELCFNEWKRILKDGGYVYCMTDWRTYPFLYPIMIKYLTVRNLIVWDYEWIKCGAWYRFSHELIMFASKGGGGRNFSNKERDVWRMKPINYTSSHKHHQAEKPVALMERMIINSTAEGDNVLDCFMGSGTSGVAAINTGRRFIGFELEKKFYDIAQKRISEAIVQREQPLFR